MVKSTPAFTVGFLAWLLRELSLNEGNFPAPELLDRFRARTWGFAVIISFRCCRRRSISKRQQIFADIFRCLWVSSDIYRHFQISITYKYNIQISITYKYNID